MLTVPEAAHRAGKSPETIRRWIRAGRLPSRRVGTQHLVDERELDALTAPVELPVPASWGEPISGRPLPNVVAIVRRQRAEH